MPSCYDITDVQISFYWTAFHTCLPLGYFWFLFLLQYLSANVIGIYYDEINNRTYNLLVNKGFVIFEEHLIETTEKLNWKTIKYLFIQNDCV